MVLFIVIATAIAALNTVKWPRALDCSPPLPRAGRTFSMVAKKGNDPEQHPTMMQGSIDVIVTTNLPAACCTEITNITREHSGAGNEAALIDMYRCGYEAGRRMRQTRDFSYSDVTDADTALGTTNKILHRHLKELDAACRAEGRDRTVTEKRDLYNAIATQNTWAALVHGAMDYDNGDYDPYRTQPFQHNTSTEPPSQAACSEVGKSTQAPQAACGGASKPGTNPRPQSIAAVTTDLTGRVKKTTQVCVKFREGREVCKKGASCRKLHITPKKICTNPSYQETGICSNWSKCRCRHPWDEEKWGSHNDACEKYLKLQAK